MIIHEVRVQELADGQAHWECSCGRAGTCAEERVDLHSDRHIPQDGTAKRVDSSRSLDDPW